MLKRPESTLQMTSLNFKFYLRFVNCVFVLTEHKIEAKNEFYFYFQSMVEEKCHRRYQDQYGMEFSNDEKSFICFETQILNSTSMVSLVMNLFFIFWFIMTSSNSSSSSLIRIIKSGEQRLDH